MARLSSFLYLTFTLISLFVMDASSQASPPPCVEACLEAAASNSGCSPTDANCVCNSQVIADAVATCVVDQCSVADAQAAATYFDNFCSGATSPSPSSESFSVEPSTIGSTEAPSSTVSTPSTGTILSTPSTNSTSTPGSSPLFTSSQPATPTQQSTSQQQSTTGPTTSISSRPSTGSTASPTSVTTSPTPTNHAERGRTSRSFTNIVFALAVAIVVW